MFMINNKFLVTTIVILAILCAGVWPAMLKQNKDVDIFPRVEKSFFDLSATDIDGNTYNFSTLKNNAKATLIFNSASLWG